ncbi:MAG: thiol:disulfide interchange protein DsbA/DsbL [Steroidobacteraceae bacterium]
MKAGVGKVLAAALLVMGAALAQGADWAEGTHYTVLRPAQPTNVPAGKIEVVEIFSYACPACYQFRPFANKLKAALPKNAVLSYVPASFLPAEDWPVFQRAFFAADALGLVDKTHDAMFDAIWKSYELGVIDPNTRRPRKPLPAIEDVAKFYQRAAGVQPDKFLSVANSFSTDTNMNRADAYLKSTKVASTPTLIVNGKYKLDPSSAGGSQQVVDLVLWLVAKESGTH